MHRTRVRSRVARSSIFLLTAALLVGCSGSSGAPTADDGPGEQEAEGETAVDDDVPEGDDVAPVSRLTDGFIRPQEDGSPVDGGELRLAAFLEPASLDPAVTIVAGTTGGIEMLNLFDSLTRWDNEEQAFVPQTAETVEANATFDEWTVTLRPGITFSDGEVYDAEAVKASQERYAELPSPEGNFWQENVAEIEVVGDLELKYTLISPWGDFPSLLSTGPGMIVSPQGYADEDDFEPIGAGPFTLEEWKAGEFISFVKRDDYWAGEPHLDGFTSVFLNDQQVAVDTLNSGGVDAVFALHASFVEQLVSSDYNGLVSTLAAGAAILINADEGSPGEDLRVRRAIQLAIDPQVVMDRAYQGVVDGATSLFPSNSMWATETRGPDPDLEEAKRLLEEAKADGYDGKLKHIDLSDPSNRNRAGAVQAQLEAAGFEVEVDLARSSAEQIQTVMVERDYDIAAWGTNVRNVNPLPRFFTNFHSEGNLTSGIYTSPEMDEQIEAFKEAPDNEGRLAAIDRIQQRLNEDVPMVMLGQLAEILAWDGKVRGIKESGNTTALFNEVWLDG